MPSTSLNCFPLPLPLLGGFSLIVSAATAVTLADMHTFGTADAYGGGLPKNSRAGTTAAKVANPGGAADVRPAQIGALTTRAAGTTTTPSMMIGSQFAADKTMPSGVHSSDGAIGNTTIFLEANLPAARTAVAVALPRHSAEELQPIDLHRQGVAARSEPPPLTWMILFFFFCALRAAAALLAGILYALAAPNDTVRARADASHCLSLSPAALRTQERPAADRLVLTRVRAVCACAQGLASRGRISFGRRSRGAHRSMPSAVAKGVALLVLFGGVSPAAGQNNVFANKAALQTGVVVTARRHAASR